MSRTLLTFNPEAYSTDGNALLFGVAISRPKPEFGISALEEIDLASHFLEADSRASLTALLSYIIRQSSAMHGAALPAHAVEPLLQQLMGVAAIVRSALRSEGGRRFALSPEAIFGTELEGLSPEDQEFETARRFIQFSGALARAAVSGGRAPRTDLIASHAGNLAVRRLAPGLPQALDQTTFNTRTQVRSGQ